MRRSLPFNALRVFEVAARTGSFSEAARELATTHGAVSRQIGILEDWLGQRLFARSGRRMVATPLARQFAVEVGLSFDRITLAAEACGRMDARKIIRVNAPTSIAMRWLIPRLDRFHRDNPNIEVSVTTISGVQEERRAGYDVAIRRGVADDGAWPQHRATHIFEDVDTLIMSPALFAERPIREAADVEDHVLLGTETCPGDWNDWLDAAGLPHLISRSKRLFDHFFVTRQAVEDGFGIGVGPLPMLEYDIECGRLMTPLPQIAVARAGYVALMPHGKEAMLPVNRFVDWLVAEGKLKINVSNFVSG